MEKNGNGNTVLLTVIGVATLLVALVGATFAYFTAAVTGNNSQTVQVGAANPTGLTYTQAGTALSLQNGIPGETDEKTFTIANNDPNNTYKYDLQLVIDKNDFQTTVPGEGEPALPSGEDGNGQLVFTFTGKDEANAALTLTTSEYDATGKGTTAIQVDTGRIIQTGKTYSYTASVEFVNKEYSQNNNAEAQFTGHFHVDRAATHNVSTTPAAPSEG